MLHRQSSGPAAPAGQGSGGPAGGVLQAEAPCPLPPPPAPLGRALQEQMRQGDGNERLRPGTPPGKNRTKQAGTGTWGHRDAPWLQSGTQSSPVPLPPSQCRRRGWRYPGEPRGPEGLSPSSRPGHRVHREDTGHSRLLLVLALGAGTRALRPLPPPPLPAGLAPGTGDLGFKEQAAAAAPAHPLGEEAGELQQSPCAVAGEMAAAGHRATPPRGAAGSGGQDGGAPQGGCQVLVFPRWVLGAGALGHHPEREAGAMPGTRHLLVPVILWPGGDP